MGGAGPYVRFDPSYRSSSPWASHTGLTQMSDEELEAAYTRAKDLLMDKKRELVDVHGWCIQAEDHDALFAVTKQSVQLCLPVNFASFRDEAKGIWEKMFQNYRLFKPERRDRNNSTLFMNSPTPISDIFYLLQILAPGMLLIVREEEYDTIEKEIARALPSVEWLKEHQSILEHVLGNNQKFELLISAAADFAKSFRSITDYYPNDHDWDDHYTTAWGTREVLDFAACDSECGYCGRCDY